MGNGEPPAADPSDDARPWEARGAVRRDCAPHRSHILAFLAEVALMLSVFTFCLGPLGILTVGLATTVSVLARGDLVKMRAGTMDPSGFPQAQKAQEVAWLALILGVIGGCVCGVPMAAFLLHAVR
jgi:hypothetical protein